MKRGIFFSIFTCGLGLLCAVLFFWNISPGMSHVQAAGAWGGTFDAECPGGYFVAFDTFEFSASFPDIIYIAHESQTNRLVVVLAPFNLEDGQWHEVTIAFDQGTVTVHLDGIPVINQFTIPDYLPFWGYFGVSAATGMFFNEQRVDELEVYVILDETMLLPTVYR